MLLLVVLQALIQGLTEFLPVSSSGHLVLFWSGMDAAGNAQTLALSKQAELELDVAVHLGTLLAVCLYFWRDCAALLRGFFKLLRGKIDSDSQLFSALAVASLPVFAAGFVLKSTGLIDALRSPLVIASTTIIFGLLLGWADKVGMHSKTNAQISWRDYLLMGLSQCLALVPGTSRSGITMTTARLLGIRRDAAARSSMLLAIPAILGAACLMIVDLAQSQNASLSLYAFLAAALSFLVALVAIWGMMQWLKRASFMIFVVYRLALGAALLAWIFWPF